MNDAKGIDSLFDPTHDSRMARNRTLAPRGPRSCRIQKAGLGIRVIVEDWPHDSIETTGTGTREFRVYWAEDVDQASDAGLAAGFARRTLLSPAIPASGATNRANRGGAAQCVGFYSDPKYQIGFFWIVGADADGVESDPGNPIKIAAGGSGGTVPNDVEHFQASESGEVHDGTTLSVVSFSFRIPTVGGPVDRVQFMFFNYPTIGEFQEGESVRVTSGRGGTQIGNLKFPVGRRIGSGGITITGTSVTGGTDFLSIAAIGDQLEVLGARARITAVSASSLTLTAWSGPAVAGVADWQIIAAITIYAVSEGLNGARRDDPENAPSVTLDLDGTLSPPNAPGSIFATPLDNNVLIEAEQVSGTQLKSYLLYRSRGSGVDAGMALAPPQPSAGTVFLQAKPVDANPVTGSLIPFNDTQFEITDRESGQAFVWYVSVNNNRGDESACASVVGSCRLTTSQDVDPSLTGRVGLKNLLFDSFIGGTAGNTIIDTDTSQDAFNGTSAGNLPGKPYGGSGASVGTGRFVGHTRWHSTTDGAASIAKFINNDEAQIVAPGLSKTTHLFQEIDAWDLGLGGVPGNKLTKGGVYVLSGLFRYDTTQPTGTFSLWVDQYANNVRNGDSLRRYRDSTTQVLQYYAQGSGNNIYGVAGSELTTLWQRFFAIFKLDSAITTKQLRVNVTLTNCAVGDMRVKRMMLNEGEDIGYWTGDMGDTTVSQPNGGGPPDGGMGDGSGTRDRIPIEP